MSTGLSSRVVHRCFLKLREQSRLLFVKPESILLEDNEWGFNISGTIPTIYIPYMFRRLINKIFYLMSICSFLGARSLVVCARLHDSCVFQAQSCTHPVAFTCCSMNALIFVISFGYQKKKERCTIEVKGLGFTNY